MAKFTGNVLKIIGAATVTKKAWEGYKIVQEANAPDPQPVNWGKYLIEREQQKASGKDDPLQKL